ncbi:hypothetical protein EGM88_13650 [Aureibaculum marinum]|uniref:2TM domain-containing protein n=1 Tax=Aureibaculum marinum TaxID=2487930 RepID=A0A3N4NCC6_9FLAO|nr:2TM domain-containing protein [Aureibaculum marinum]RPD92995.1 hypothetical protein EGM88_13650 [Aureibaculum marinum]
MELEQTNTIKYRQARKRVKELKGFYWHLAIYVLINLFITINKVISNYYNGQSESWSEAIWNFDTFSVWIFWGVGIAFHAINIFGYPLILGKDWEECKIKKLMEKEEEQSKLFRK